MGKSGMDTAECKTGGMEAAGIDEALQQTKQILGDLVTDGFGRVSVEYFVRNGQVERLEATHTTSHKLI